MVRMHLHKALLGSTHSSHYASLCPSSCQTTTAAIRALPPTRSGNYTFEMRELSYAFEEFNLHYFALCQLYITLCAR